MTAEPGQTGVDDVTEWQLSDYDESRWELEHNPEYGRPFFALIAGIPNGGVYEQEVHDLGILHLPTGQVMACDPYTDWLGGAGPAIPPGDYRAKVTLADVNRDDEPVGAYLSIVVRDDLPVGLVRELHQWDASRKPSPWRIPVDSGVLCFADLGAAEEIEHADLRTALGDGPESWTALQCSPENLTPGYTIALLPGAVQGANIVIGQGTGDGGYSCVTTHAADGTLLGVHIDLVKFDR